MSFPNVYFKMIMNFALPFEFIFKCFTEEIYRNMWPKSQRKETDFILRYDSKVTQRIYVLANDVL